MRTRRWHLKKKFCKKFQFPPSTIIPTHFKRIQLEQNFNFNSERVFDISFERNMKDKEKLHYILNFILVSMENLYTYDNCTKKWMKLYGISLWTRKKSLHHSFILFPFPQLKYLSSLPIANWHCQHLIDFSHL